MKKHIDKLCLHGDNIITLIKHFIKHKTKQHKKEETIMLQQVMTNPGEIIFREVPGRNMGLRYRCLCRCGCRL